MKTYVFAAASIIALTPLSARAADSDQACATPKQYIALVQQGRFDQIGALFATDAVVYTPIGTVLRGSVAISDFYKNTVAAVKLVVRGENFVADKSDCFFEIWSKSSKNAEGRYVPDPNGEFMRAAADHFTVDAQGRVTQMVAFPAPGVSTVSAAK